MTKDEARARTAFEAARAQQEKIVQAQPDYGPALCVLGLIDAALGRKDLALDEGRRAIALTPVEKDVNNGSRVLQYFAITAAWAGEKELALQQLEAGLRAPAASLMLSYGALKLFPVWDPLRGDPRFEKIVESLAPKEDTNFTNCHQSDDDSRFDSCGFVKFVSKIVARSRQSSTTCLDVLDELRPGLRKCHQKRRFGCAAFHRTKGKQSIRPHSFRPDCQSFSASAKMRFILRTSIR